MIIESKNIIICDAKKLLRVKHDIKKIEQLIEKNPNLARIRLHKIFNYIITELLDSIET